MKEKNLNLEDLNNICLDTDTIIDALKSKEFGNKLIKLKNKGISLYTTTINTFELLKGVREKEKKDLYNFFSGIRILNFDFRASEKSAQIFNDLKTQGKPLDIADVIIASIAITNNQLLLTKNKKHFERIPELNLGTID